MSAPKAKIGPHFWIAVDATERNAISLAEGAVVGDLCYVLSDNQLYSAATVSGSSSTWSLVSAVPAAHASTHNAGGGDALAIDAAAGTGSLRTLGTGAQTACAGNDSRLSDSRTPTSHASTHNPGGGDALTTAAAVAVGTTNAEGTNTSYARSDHTHEVTGLKIASEAQGDVLYRNASGWVRLPAGTSGQHLRTNGTGANPSWETPSGGSADKVCLFFLPAQASTPSTNYPTVDERNNHRILDFNESTDKTCYFSGIMPVGYSTGNSIKVTVIWAATSATSNDCVWEGYFERLAENAQDIDSDGFYTTTAKYAKETANGSSGKLVYTSITYSNAEADGIQPGEAFRYRLNRDADSTNDTDNMSGDAELWGLLIEEV